MAAAKIPIKYAFLEKMALDMGAIEAAVIPAGGIVVEDRVIWKCRNGCSDYGMPEHAVGINMIRTAAKAGMPISFPIKGSPEPMALVLID